MSPDVLRNALVYIYDDGYISKFARKIGYSRQTVHRWLIGKNPVPVVVIQVLILLLREKRREEASNDS